MACIVRILPKNAHVTVKCALRARTFLAARHMLVAPNFKNHVRFKSDSSSKGLTDLVEPISVKPCNDPDGINVGAEITGESIDKGKQNIF